jgi:AraC family transcriptional regulator of adaptative response/methylated-DNA-[protein]-cysteine methyltransferase
MRGGAETAANYPSGGVSARFDRKGREAPASRVAYLVSQGRYPANDAGLGNMSENGSDGSGHVLATDEARYEAIRRRDAAYDGSFVYAVRTTGVYCRPSCPSRLANRKNVSFHADGKAAEAAGFRPCRRCRPEAESQSARHAMLIRQACQTIDDAESVPKLADLTRQAGLSLFHFHRVFKQITGVTPHAYAQARRAARMQHALADAASVTQAIYAAGYNAPSRFYAAAPDRLGMTPSAYRKGGVQTSVKFAVGACSLGAILVAATSQGICAITLGDDPARLVRELQDRFPRAELAGDDAAFASLVSRVVGCVEARSSAADLPLDIRGTAFQQRVWEALRAIPPGSTATYGEIAAAIGAPASVRAVAGACARNELAVAIPCHRVVRSDGALSGYRWGVERKAKLLEQEKAASRGEFGSKLRDASR